MSSIEGGAWACIPCRIWLWPEDSGCFNCGAQNPHPQIAVAPIPAPIGAPPLRLAGTVWCSVIENRRS